MLTQIEDDLGKQKAWVRQCATRDDFFHRIIRIEDRDVGYCSINIRDSETGIGELGVYIGEKDTPRQLSIYNFLGTTNHAFFTLHLQKLVNRINGNNPRTLRLQAFNGYRPVSAPQLQGVPNEAPQELHYFELRKDDWHEFRKKFDYFKDWEGNPT
jgi:RimJ/RimL family protein N-acetyltransferase